LVVAGPVVHPWYLLWALVPLAAAARGDAMRRTVALGSIALVLLVLPGGVQPGLQAFIGAILGASTVLFVVRALSDPDRPNRWDQSVAGPLKQGHPAAVPAQPGP